MKKTGLVIAIIYFIISGTISGQSFNKTPGLNIFSTSTLITTNNKLIMVLSDTSHGYFARACVITDTMGQLNNAFACDSFRIFSMIQTSDAGFMFSMIKNGYEYQSDSLYVSFLKTDSLFQFQWQRSLIDSTGSWPFLCISNTNGTITYSGQNRIFNLSLNGVINWSRSFQHTFFSKIISTPDSGVLAFGNTDTNKCYVKLDRDGAIVWSKYSSGFESPTDIANSDSNNFYLLLSRETFQPMIKSTKLIKVDNSGNVIWSKKYSQNHDEILGGHVFPLSDKTILLSGHDAVGYGIVTHLDSAGSPLSGNKNSTGTFPFLISEKSNGYYFFGGSSGSIMHFGYENNVDSLQCSGIPISISEVNSIDSLYNLPVASDTGIVLTNDTSTFYPLNWTIFDECLSTNIIGKEIQAAFLIYPNPNDGTFIVKPNTPGPFTMKIFNAFGELIFTSLIYGKQENVFSEKLNSGIYLVQTHDGTGTHISKLIVR